MKDRHWNLATGAINIGNLIFCFEHGSPNWCFALSGFAIGISLTAFAFLEVQERVRREARKLKSPKTIYEFLDKL